MRPEFLRRKGLFGAQKLYYPNTELWLLTAITKIVIVRIMITTGRPTSYRPDHCNLAREHGLLGATNDEPAEVFDVAPRTIDNWIAHHPIFAAAGREGRKRADAKVAASLASAAASTHARSRR